MNIALFRGSTFLHYIASGVGVGSSGYGSYTWQIPTTQATGSDFKIGIESASVMNIYDTSDNAFTITSGPVTPVLTVTSPNGGESWVQGSTHTITWTSVGGCWIVCKGGGTESRLP